MSNWITRQEPKSWIGKQWSLLTFAWKYEGNLARKFKFWGFARLAARKGVIHFRIPRVADLYVKDWFDYDGATKEEKKWANENGFSSYKMAPWYGVAKDNFTNYISDFDFYAIRNYNPQRDILAWYENKLNTYFLLAPFRDSMPRHYYYIYGGRIMPLDVDVAADATVDSLVQLLDRGGAFAIKACYGGHGVGFYKIERKDGVFFVNEKMTSRDELATVFGELDNYIVTEYVRPHSKFRQMCGDDAFAVIRAITVFDPVDGPQLTCCEIRLGCKAAGVTTDHEGTIYCGISLKDGVSFKPLYRQSEEVYTACERHPDTQVPLAGFVLPNFEALRKLVLSISRKVPMTPYLVMDIIPTDTGFSILEINSHGQVRVMEPFYPFGANRYNRKVFKLGQDRN